MKKFVSIISIVLVLVLTATNSFAAGNKTQQVQEKTEQLRNYLYGDYYTAPEDKFGLENSYDFLLYLLADGGFMRFKESYINALREAIEGGQTITADTYALAFRCLEKMGEKPEKFELSDKTIISLKEKMEQAGTELNSPYNAFYVLSLSTDKEYSAAILNSLKSSYTPGKGMDYWGYWIDNTINFAAIFKKYAPEEKTLINDAFDIIEHSKTDGGYISLEGETEPNSNSTASALFLYSVINERSLADETYELLKEFYNSDDGGYAYTKSEESNFLASRDVLKAFIYYRDLLEQADSDENDEQMQRDDILNDLDYTEDETISSQTQSTPPTGENIHLPMAVAITGVSLAALFLAKRKQK